MNENEYVLEIEKGFQYNILKTIAANRHRVSKNGMQVLPDPEGTPGILA